MKLNELKTTIGVWPEYSSKKKVHETILRVQGPDTKRYYLKHITYTGDFPEFVKEVFSHILESDPDTAEQVDPTNTMYELDVDQRSDLEVLRANLKEEPT